MEVVSMKHKWWISALFVIILGYFMVLAIQQLTRSNSLSTTEVTQQVETIYNAKVQSVVEQQHHFITSFNKDGSIFEVKIDKINGQLSDLALVHQSEVPPNEANSDENENSENSPNNDPYQKPLLSEQEAMNIALKEVPGAFDSIDFVQTTDGGNYFIEIEQEENEIKIQIHAITGKILSIQYDD